MLQHAKLLVLASCLFAICTSAGLAAEREDVRKVINLVTAVKMPYPEGLSRNRAKTERVWLTPDDVKSNLPKVQQLNEIAQQRGQSLAQMAVAWTLRKPAVTSSLIGASSVKQLEDNLSALSNLKFSEDELEKIEAILK